MNEEDIIKLNDLVSKLHDLGNALYSKWGTESYVERCNLSDIRDEIVRVVERAKISLINQLDSELSMTEQPFEKEVLEQMHLMCIESLSPENFTNWGKIKRSLIKDRESLK